MVRPGNHRLVGTAVLLIGGLAPQVPSAATSYICWSLPERIMSAEAVVAGRTIEQTKTPHRPGIDRFTYRFRVDEVIKGTVWHPGDIIEEGDISHGSYITTFLPPPGGGRVIFFDRQEDGALRSTPCGLSLEKADLPALRRLAGVLAEPEKHLDSPDPRALSAVLSWIRFHYFGPGHMDFEKPYVAPGPPIDRDTAIEFAARHAADEESPIHDEAVSLLNAIAPPKHYALLRSLASDVEPYRSAGGLQRLEARRRIPELVENVRTLREEFVEHAKAGATDHPSNEWQARYFEAVDALLKSLDQARDRNLALQVKQELGVRSRKPERIPFDTSLALMLDVAGGAGKRIEVDVRALNPAAVGEARRNIRESREAVHLLASRGDPADRDFMLRLIRAGHRDGGLWAALVQDNALVPRLLEAMQHATYADHMAFALARMRAFPTIKNVLAIRQQFRRRDVSVMYLAGLMQHPSPFYDFRNPLLGLHVRQGLWEQADRERWPEYFWSDVVRLVEQMEHDANTVSSDIWAFRDLTRPWSPPCGLPGMPDYLDRAKVGLYLHRNHARVETVLRASSPPDIMSILHALRATDNQITPNLAVTLLMHDSYYVRSMAFILMREHAIALDEDQLLRLVESGDYEATSTALRYIAGEGNRRHASVVLMALDRGWHLYDEQLYRAIIATEAREAVPTLRKLVADHHIDVRRWAAFALAHFGDDAGAAVLRSLVNQDPPISRAPGRKEVAEALEKLRAAGASER